MSQSKYFVSSIGRKQVMAIAGILLCLFVLMHAAGNMLIFVGPAAYNKYSHVLISNPFIYLAEAGLVVFFIGHILSGIVVSVLNSEARDTGYAKLAKGEKKTSLVARSMLLQGLIVLGFVVLHLITFKYGANYDTTIDGVKMRDIFTLVSETFMSPLYVAWYVIAVVILGFHLGHGLASSFQTLGLNHPKYSELIKKISVLYSFVVTAAFVSQPLYMFFIYKG
jgi:succinate dehydrogenase / fumarate reductase cytochrome b subunit